MVKIIINSLTRGKVAKNILLVLVLFILILTISPQNALAEENRQVNASEILEKIEKGVLVAEENCTIIGDLDLSKINLSTIKVDGRELRRVNNSISIKNSIIKGNVNFRGESKNKKVYFRGPVNFDGTNFAEEANFMHSIFSDSAHFDNATFDGIAKFGDVEFTHATFWNATFNNRSSFAYSIFYDHGLFTFANFSHFSAFDYAHFNNGASFNFVHFNGEVRFCGTCFYNNVRFTGTVFSDRAHFHSVVFNGFTSFNCDFMNDTYFQNATFNGIVIFNKDFHVVANFADAKFNDRVEFTDYFKFNENALFCDATFTGLADFENARFVKDTDFSNAEFNDVAKFKKVTFNDSASFMDASFKKADFEDARFVQTANFNHTEFNDEANFQNAIFNDTAYFILARFKDRAYFTGASFNDTVDFSDADIFLTMKINWSQLEEKLVYDGYYYQTLIRNFETLGQSEDANDAYYKYKVEKRKHLKSPLDPLWKGLEEGVGCIISLFGSVLEFIDLGLRRPLEFIFLDLSCGYGVKPLNPLGCAVIIILLFAGFYRLIEDKENNKSYSDSSLKDRISKFVFLSVSIFTTLGYWNKWKPAKNHETKFRIGVIIEALLGWIIMALFVISLTMTWIR